MILVSLQQLLVAFRTLWLRSLWELQASPMPTIIVKVSINSSLVGQRPRNTLVVPAPSWHLLLMVLLSHTLPLLVEKKWEASYNEIYIGEDAQITELIYARHV